ncbi:tetratricopeptide repeat domain-containing protein, partial [Metarhizium majus ARSEF 297]
MNLFEEAEGVSLEGLPAAERNSGEHHLGTLTARTWLAHLYWRQGRYSDAEAIWEDIIQKRNYEQSKRTDGELTDRIEAMWFLAHCYEDQGKINDALRMCEQITKLRSFNSKGRWQHHKLWQSVAQKTEELPADELSKAGEHLPGDET